VSNGTAISGATPGGALGGLDIRAADIDITAPLAVRGTGVGIQVVSTGAVVLGDGVAAVTGALRLSNAELQQFDAPSVGVGVASNTSGSADLRVGDLQLDGARIGGLTLATGSNGKILVSGTVRGTGAPSLTLGVDGVKPGAIEITGALGTSSAPLGTLRLRAGSDILIGSSAFIDRLKTLGDLATIDIASLPQNLEGATAGQLFIVSGPASFEAGRAILQQNTGGRTGDGIRIGAAGAVVPSTLVVGGPTTPARVALFGSVVGSSGTALTGPAAASASGLLPAGASTNASWRLNGCIIGSGGGCASAENPVDTVVAAVRTTAPASTAPPPPGPAGPASDPPPPTAGAAKKGPAKDDQPGERPPPKEDEEREPTQEEQRAAAAADKVADAPLESEAASLRPIEVDVGSRDLLNRSAQRDGREVGVGSANEDLWPQTPLPQ